MAAAGQIIPLLLFVIGALLLIASYRLTRAIRPTGHVDQVDGDTEAYVPHGLLILVEDRLAGQPHGLLRLADRQQTIPIQVIDRASPAVPDQVAGCQMSAFCYLVEAIYDQEVPYGMLRYADLDVQIDWTPENRQALADLLSEMRLQAEASNVDRSHNTPSICAACIVKEVCDQALV
ncbi:MAG: Dna2/Cas4 domain-containing protein [Anaerolineae bacterium]|nr:Dna2/Cas4 domain-containing protein [Anaerolineae bacterium]